MQLIIVEDHKALPGIIMGDIGIASSLIVRLARSHFRMQGQRLSQDVRLPTTVSLGSTACAYRRRICCPNLHK